MPDNGWNEYEKLVLDKLSTLRLYQLRMRKNNDRKNA